ncbi:protein Wnt-6-like isoform X1 [Sphaerodactylus townsendi]|uniref:protein Wnt-6-like isoform X1 n=1 Tax=Sphaerodactylus townsendi TaxID=933632 RepID=UPI0020267B64|nr:protein Wnt-6-like isoform X1 [Sphaerodactylus townsendi]
MSAVPPPLPDSVPLSGPPEGDGNRRCARNAPLGTGSAPSFPPASLPLCLSPSPPSAPLCLSGGGSLVRPSVPSVRPLAASLSSSARDLAHQPPLSQPASPACPARALCASQGARCAALEEGSALDRPASFPLLLVAAAPAGCWPRPAPSWGFSSSCSARPTSSGYGVGSPLVMDPNSICRKTKRLAGKQAELCQTEPEIVQEVAKGARLGVRECQYQFRFRRWNCTSHSKYFGKILQQDIRETAFVYAITAAGVSHAVTQACSMGELLQCGCEATRSRAPPLPPTITGSEGSAWEWGGCGDDVDFGYEKSRQFMDAKRKRGKSDIRTLIDLHNNEAGRLAVRNHILGPVPCPRAIQEFLCLRTLLKEDAPFEIG